jgi:4-amino-4-deoxy-L-arabinose transferase-like glycosyltransferase
VKVAEQKKITRPQRRHLWLMVALLWGLWAVRAHNIMQLPVFVDESLHILRAQMVFQFDDATASFLPGKLLLYYYLGLFNPQDVGGAWLARQAVALLAPLGAALTFALARTLFRRGMVGLIAAGLYGLMPFMVFFERMALSDTFAMVFGLGLAIMAVRLARRPSTGRAIMTGLLFGLAMLAKLIALPWALLVPLATWLFGGGRWTKQRRWYLIAGLSAGLVFAPSAAYVVYQEFGPVEKQEVVTTTLFVPEEKSRLEQIGDNLESYGEASVAFFTWPFLLLLVGLGSWQIHETPKEGSYLLSFALLAWGFVTVTSAAPSTRYLVIGVPALLVLVAARLERLGRSLWTMGQKPDLSTVWQKQLVFILSSVFLLVWAMLSLNFIITTWNDPVELSLAERDTWEYYQNSASGYALVEAAEDLPVLSPLHEGEETLQVAGFVAACHTLRLYLPADADVEIICPYFRWNIDMAEETLVEWEAKVRRDRQWYFLSDDVQPLDLSRLPFRWIELVVYERPHDGVTTRLFRVEWAGEEQGRTDA